MANFGELVLVIGDHHIPSRSNVIPEKFRRMLVPNKMQHVICTGNLGSREQYDELRQLAPNVHVVSGDCDGMGGGTNDMPQMPPTRVVQIGEFRIGLIHGHQVLPWGDHMALAGIRRKLNVDILVSGHTHQNEVVEHDGCFHINPILNLFVYVCAGIGNWSI
eukprot:1055904_1